VRTLAEAARRLQGPTVIEVDAGTYSGDVAVWDGAQVTLRAVGGRVILRAEGASAEGKAIWVVRNSTMQVSGFDFVGAQVPDANGAGIRFESGRLDVRDCVFTGNQNGILTGNDRQAVLDIENSEFGHNGHGDGGSHNLYVGYIASLRVQGSWFHHAKRGHLLKSRAGRNVVAYNRLADGDGGIASYELEFPSGGVAIVLGNVIHQAATTENPHIVSYGAEGYGWPENRLVMAHNTLVDDRRSGGVALRVRTGAQPVVVVNNLLVGGSGDLGPAIAAGHYTGNVRATAADLTPSNPPGALQRLPARSPLADNTVRPAAVGGVELHPSLEYSPPRGTVARRDARPAAPAPGAFATGVEGR
jgi:hypothetical protein